jgi:hypothetical protein
VATIQHSLTSVVSALNEKIAALESAKTNVQREIDNGNHVPENSACLEQINESLEAAEEAKQYLMDSCCGSQGCAFEWFPSSGA